MQRASIRAGLDATARLLDRTDAAARLVAQTPAWSTGALHSKIRYVGFDAHVSGEAVAGLSGGRSLGAQLQHVGRRIEEISGWLDDSARSAGPFDISNAERAHFAELLESPLRSAQHLGGAARSALQEAAAGARHVDVRRHPPLA